MAINIPLKSQLQRKLEELMPLSVMERSGYFLVPLQYHIYYEAFSKPLQPSQMVLHRVGFLIQCCKGQSKVNVNV